MTAKHFGSLDGDELFTLHLTGESGPLNLRTEADLNGYDGENKVQITLSGSIKGADVGPSIDSAACRTGSWPDGTDVFFVVENGGVVLGKGAPRADTDGGGLAIRCENAITIILAGGGQISGGGHGGIDGSCVCNSTKPPGACSGGSCSKGQGGGGAGANPSDRATESTQGNGTNSNCSGCNCGSCSSQTSGQDGGPLGDAKAIDFDGHTVTFINNGGQLNGATS